MPQAWHALPRNSDSIGIDIGRNHAGLSSCFSEHFAPRPYEHRVTISLAAIRVHATLCRRDHKGSALDRASSQQDIPVRLARGFGEGTWHREEGTARLREPAIELREAQIVADRQANSAPWKIGDSGPVSAGDGV